MRGFDWPSLMAAGLRGLRLRPADFWALTPAELQMILGQGAGAPALTRKGLDALLATYPDKTEGHEDERD
ncbi:phage conserved hypothetical protein [Shimia gijangensis]|uniref:Phage tail assembly chaperone protein, TAC n=1 Tax=Shimia gijangensis TaxID=1470563 RepID=A0A1M6EH01_9RHOB|nr:rcc01693 family protein [Shimia gijangensis]SHI84772.1 phage conserved hypothetical protein [Shimia gijangensis]